MPGAGLREVFGVWEEESLGYFPHESVGVRMSDGNRLGLRGDYRSVDICSVVHAEGAEVLATYTEDHFAGAPALTVNTFGKGRAWFLAARMQADFLGDFYARLTADLGIAKTMDTVLPPGVTAQMRTDGTRRFVFLQNFNRHPVRVQLDAQYHDLLNDTTLAGEVALERYGVRVLERTC